MVQALLRKSAAAGTAEDAKFPPRFLLNGWTGVVDARQSACWDAYKDAPRPGRKTCLGEKQRRALRAVSEATPAEPRARKLATRARVFGRLADAAASGKLPAACDFAVVDEAQDLGMAGARFLAATAGKKADGLFFAGDLGQRVFQQPFSWKVLGLDARGRSHGRRINHRTSHQIRVQADRLLPGAVSDVDGTEDGRRGTVSLFEGPTPTVGLFRNAAAEIQAVGAWVAAGLQEGCAPEEIGVLIRSPAQAGRARAAVGRRGGGRGVRQGGGAGARAVPIGQTHLAKGLEFRAVAVMACDDGALPLQERVERAADEADLEELYETERHLLHVACTRARDDLWVSGVAPGSEFLRDLAG